MSIPSWTNVARGAWLAACLVLCGGEPGWAASITWGPAQAISGDSDVQTDGTLVAAINVGGPQTAVNGVAFEAFALGAASNTLGDITLSVSSGIMQANAVGSAATPFTSLSSGYRDLLGSNNNNSSGAALTTTVTINGLVVGQTYQVQIWNNESLSFNPPGFTFKSELDPGNRILDPNPSTNDGGLGEYAVGTFVADSSSQVITVFAEEIGGRLNGLQLRAVPPVSVSTVPAASMPTLVFLGLALAFVGLLRLPGSPVATRR